ncbi:MAG: hypothetical protein ACUVQ3_08730 [bacterium]
MTEKFKPGPYNYCDYRCDRCEEKDNCRVYKENEERMLQHYLRGEDPNDPQIFMNDLKDIFEKTEDILRKAAEEQGIDVDESAEEEIREVDPHSYAIYHYAYEYYAQAKELVRKIENTLIPDAIKDDFEDFAWYYTLLLAKAGRLVSGFDDKFFDEEVRKVEEEGTIQVINKSVALSKKALENMLNELPDDFQKIVNLLDLLKKIEKQLKTDMRAKVN